MKKYIKELIILLIQLIFFYIMPLTAGPTDMMGLVVLIIIVTFILGVILGFISNNKIKYLYPIIISVLFLPTIIIYYNESAWIHSIWYLVISLVGLLVGLLIKYIWYKIKKWYYSYE